MPSFKDADIMRVECDGHLLLCFQVPWRNQYVFILIFAQFVLIPLPLWSTCSVPVTTINDKDRLHTIQLET